MHAHKQCAALAARLPPRRTWSRPLSPTITNSERWPSLTLFSTSVRMRESTFFLIVAAVQRLLCYCSPAAECGGSGVVAAAVEHRGWRAAPRGTHPASTAGCRAPHLVQLGIGAATACCSGACRRPQSPPDRLLAAPNCSQMYPQLLPTARRAVAAERGGPRSMRCPQRGFICYSSVATQAEQR